MIRKYPNPQTSGPSPESPAAHPKESAFDKMVRVNWPELWNRVKTDSPHLIGCDDREGTLVVIPDRMGDLHICIEPCQGMLGARPSFRARTFSGGGRNERVRIALALLALAIEEDNARIPLPL